MTPGPHESGDRRTSKATSKHGRTGQPDVASLIQTWTGGILRDIMVLVVDASIHAILEQEPCLSVARLETTWRHIQTHQIWNFLPAAARTDSGGDARGHLGAAGRYAL